MNNRIKNLLSLFVVFIALFCLFSCSNTLPTQTTVTIKRINSESFDPYDIPSITDLEGYWEDTSVLDGSSKVTAFIGAKFARTIQERTFTVLSEDGDHYLYYKFDGATYSDSPILNHPGNNNSGQKPFTGNVTATSSDFTLYAYYTYEIYEVQAVDMSGTITHTRFVSIPSNAPQTLTLKLNKGRVFINTIQAGGEVPNDWVFPKVEGLKYTIASVVDNNRVTIAVTGTPLKITAIPEDGSIIIPKVYVENAEIDIKGQNKQLYNISEPTIDVSNQIISGSKYKEIKEGEQQLKFTISNGASFNDDVIKSGTFLNEYDGIQIATVEGLEYKITSIAANEIIVSIYGYPGEVSTDNLNFSAFKERYIKGGTSDDLIQNTDTSKPLQSTGSKYNITPIVVDLSTSDGGRALNLVNSVVIPENDSKVISLKITSGAKFNRDSVKQNEKVDWTSFQGFSGVQGLNFKFGSLEDTEDGSLLNILVYGTPKFNTEGEMVIDNIYIPSSAIEGAPTNADNETAGSLTINKSNVKLTVAPFNETLNNYGTEENPIQGTQNVELGNGKGVNVRLILENATFNDSVSEYLEDCFSGLSDAFGYTATESTYSIVTGGVKNASDVVVAVKGAPMNLSEGSGTVTITLPNKVITNGGEGLNDVSAELHYKTSTSSLKVDNSGSNLGADEESPLVATRGALIGSTNDKEVVHLRLNLSNAVFKESFKDNADIQDWFKNLNSEWGDNLSYSIIENMVDKDDDGNIVGGHLIINIDGTPTSSNDYPKKVDITIPRSAIEGATDEYKSHIVPIFYRIKGSVEARVVGNGSQDKPIKTTQYVMLNDGNGENINIKLEGGQFKDVNANDDVSSWFKNWTEDGIDNAEFRVVNLISSDTVTISVKGSIRKSTQDGTANRVNVIIPRNKIKNGDKLNTDLTAHLFYNATAQIGVEFSSEDLYYGTAIKPLEGVRGISMNNGNGLDVKLTITNGGRFINDVEVGGDIGVETWFSAFRENNSPKYSIVRGGKKDDDFIVVHIDGALMGESGVVKSVPITLNKALFNGVLINDLTTTLYYTSIAEVSAEISTRAAYFGSSDYPLKGVRYMPLSTFGNGDEIRLELNNAKFVSTLSNGQYVNDWFDAFTDIAGMKTFRIIEVGNDRDYVIIKIDAALTSDVITDADSSDSVIVSIPYNQIDGYLTENVNTSLYYKTTAEVSATVYSGTGYFGSFENPIKDSQRVALGDGEGVLVRINLENTTFNETVDDKYNFARWFEAFDEITNKEFTYVAGGSGEGYVVINVKGSLITDAKQSKAINIKVSSDAISGYLPKALETPLYYCITNPVTATFDLSGVYKGSSAFPIEGISYVPLGEKGEGVELKINLAGGKFREDIGNDDVLGWFSQFGDLDNKIVTIKDKGDYSYIAFVLQGTLSYVDLSSVRTSEVRIPVDDIQNASFTTDVVLDVNYRTIGEVSATLDDSGEYKGATDEKCLSSVQNVPYNVIIKINLENGSFKDGAITKGSDLTSWFTNFISDFPQTRFVAYNIGEKFIEIQIDGSINVAPGEIKSALITIPSGVFEGNLQSDVQTLMYYKTTEGIEVTLDSGDMYKGVQASPIEGLQYIDLNNKKGVLVRINLTSPAKFGDDVNVGYDFTSWFEDLSSKLVGPNGDNRYEYYGGGADRNFVIITVKGALRSDVTDEDIASSAKIRVPREAINAPTLTSDALETDIYYKTIGKVVANLDSNSNYYGNVSNPINGIQHLALNNGNGVLIRINLRNGNEVDTSEVPMFKDVEIGSDVSSWFSRFTNAIIGDTAYIVEEGGSGESYVVIRIKGAIGDEDKMGSFNIEIPSSAIDGYLPISQGITCSMKVESSGIVDINLEGTDTTNVDDYFGSSATPINGYPDILLGDDGKGVLVRININNTTFESNVNNTESGKDVSRWFSSLSNLMTEPTFEVVSGGDGQNFVVVRITGAFRQAETKSNVIITIPADDIKNYSAQEGLKTDLYYVIGKFVVPEVSRGSGSSEYNRYAGFEGNPISGTQYIQLGGGKGVEVKISIDNGSFNALSDEIVKSWFSALNLYESDYHIIEGGQDGDSFVVVRIKGAPVEKMNGYIDLAIPPTCVKNCKKDSDYNPSLFYNVSSEIGARLENISGYLGYDADHPLMGVKNIPFNNGNGYLIYIKLTDTTFASGVTIGSNVNSWFAEFDKDSTLIYKDCIVEEGGSGKDYVVVRVKGALSISSGALYSYKEIQIPPNALNGSFPQGVDYKARCNMYYEQQADELTATFDTIGYKGGANDDDLRVSGVQYAPLYTGDNEGVLVKLNLNGATFINNLSSNVDTWFDGITDFISAPYYNDQTHIYDDVKSFTIIDGGANENYAIIQIKGAISTNKVSSSGEVVIPASAINGYLSDSIKATLYYGSNGAINASVDNSGIYYGWSGTPLSGVQYIPLNGGKGQKIRIRLDNNAKFRKGTALINGGDVKDWFTNFGAFTEDLDSGEHSGFIVESGGAGENYVVITIRGYLNTSETSTASVEVNIPRDLIEANLPQNLNANLFYKCSGVVTATFNGDPDKRYYGSEFNPISGTSFSLLVDDSGANQQMRLELTGATFKDVDVTTNFSSWFKEWIDTGNVEGEEVVDDPSDPTVKSEPSFKLKAGGEGENYVVIEVSGKLTQKTTEKRRVRVQIPKENIDGSLKYPIYTNLCYQVQNFIRASLDMNDAFRGSYLYPITGSAGLKFSEQNKTIRIELENAKFKDKVLDVAKWFNYDKSPEETLVLPSSVIDTEGDGYKIKARGRGYNDIIIEINGGIKFGTPATDRGSLDIKIPKEDIDASLGGDLYLSLYYTSLGNVSLSLSSDSVFVGDSDSNALEGIVGVNLNNGTGSPIRVNLSNGAVFTDTINSVNPIVNGASLIREYSVVPNGGGVKASYVNYLIKGKPETVAGGTQSVTTKVRIPYENIEGCLNSAIGKTIEVDIHYIFYPLSNLSLVVSSDPSYYGSASNPLTFIPYIAFGEGSGVETKLDLVLNKNGRSSGKFTPVFSSSLTEDKLKGMFDDVFTPFMDNGSGETSGIPTEAAYSVSIVDGGSSSSSVTVKFTGYITHASLSSATDVSIKDCIAGGNASLTELKTSISIRSSMSPAVTLASPTTGTSWDWFGDEGHPITGPLRSSLYNMNVRLTLSSGLTFSENLNNTTLGDIIKGDGVNNGLYAGAEVATSVVITRGGAGYNFVEFRVDSTTPQQTQNIPKLSCDIKLPYTLISGAVEKIGNMVQTPLYYSASGSVVINVYNNGLRALPGSAEAAPLNIVNLVNLGEGEGVLTAFELSNVHLNQFAVGDSISHWFEGFTGTIEVNDLEFTVVPLGNPVTYKGTEYPGVGVGTQDFSVTTAEQAVAYTYNPSLNTYNSYIGVWIQGGSDDLKTKPSALQSFNVPITDTNDSRVKTDVTINGRMYVERKNLTFTVTGVDSNYEGSTNSKVVIGSRNIYLGYGQNTGVKINLSIQNGHFAEGTPIGNNDFINSFSEMVAGVYNIDTTGSNAISYGSDRTTATITLKGYPTVATFTSAEDLVSTSYNMNMLTKWVKGGRSSQNVIYEMPMSLSIGVPQIKSGSIGTIRGFSGMVNPIDRTLTVHAYGNAKFNNSNTITINQTGMQGINKDSGNAIGNVSLYASDGTPFEFVVQHQSNNKKDIYLILKSSKGKGHYFNTSWRNYTLNFNLALSPDLLEGVPNAVDKNNMIQNNGSYITFDILNPNNSSYIYYTYDQVIQRTPTGQDHLFMADIYFTASTWNDLGFYLQDPMFQSNAWDKIPDPNNIPFYYMIYYSRVHGYASGRYDYITRARRDNSSSTDITDTYVKIRILEVDCWSLDAKNRSFWLVANDNSTNGLGTDGSLAFNSNYGVPGLRFTAKPQTVPRWCEHKDDNRAKHYDNWDNYWAFWGGNR